MSSPRYYSSDEATSDSEVTSNKSIDSSSSDISSDEDDSSFFTKKYNPSNPYDIPINSSFSKPKSLGKIVQINFSKPPVISKSAPSISKASDSRSSRSSSSSRPEISSKNPSLPPPRSRPSPPSSSQSMSQLNSTFKNMLPELQLDSSIVKPLAILKSIADGDDKIYEMLFTLAKRYAATYKELSPLAVSVAVALTYNKFYKGVTYDRKIEETLDDLNKNLL